METPHGSWKRFLAPTALILCVLINIELLWTAKQVPRAYWELPDQQLLGWTLFLAEVAVPALVGVNIALIINTSLLGRALVAMPIAILLACVYVPISEVYSGRFGLFHRSTVAQFRVFDSDYYLLQEANENSPMCTYHVCTCPVSRRPCRCGKAQMVICQTPISYRLDIDHGEIGVRMPGSEFSYGELVFELVDP